MPRHGPVKAADLLATIPADTAADRYGDGGAVARLEAEIAGLLGKPTAVFLPSGTMVQQAVLPQDIIAEVREWRHRMGGTLVGLRPSATSALFCLARRLPQMPELVEHARAIAAALGHVPGVRVIPAADPDDAPAAEYHQGGVRGRRPWHRIRSRHLDLGSRDDDRRPRRAARGTRSGRRRPVP